MMFELSSLGISIIQEGERSEEEEEEDGIPHF